MRWEQLGDQSSQWTTGLGNRGFFLGLAVLTLFHFLLSVHFPLAEDELYYWSCAQHLQWSYFDHPPMLAFLIRLSTGIFGNNAFGIRFFSCLASTLILALLATQMRSKGLLATLAATPIVLVLSIYMTTDIPLLVCWLLYVIWAASVNRRLQEWTADPMRRVYHRSPIPLALWAVGGLCLGLGLLSKYTMALAPLCFGLLNLFNYRLRAWGPGFLAHALIAGLVASPILIYNVQTDFLPLQFQWAHSLGSTGVAAFWNFVAAQVLLVGALPLLALPWLFGFRRRLCALAELQVFFYFFAVPLAFFLIQATRGPMEGNWGLVAYVTFWPIAQVLFEDNSFKTAARLFVLTSSAPAFVGSAALLLHSFHPLSVVPVEKDRFYLLRAKYETSRLLAADIQARAPGEVVFSPTYQWTSYLKYFGVKVEGLSGGGRNHFPMGKTVSVCQQRQILALVESGHPEPSLECFGTRTEIATQWLKVRDKTVGSLAVVRFSNESLPERPSQ